MIDFFQVNQSRLACLANWNRKYTMETILQELRKYVPHLFSCTNETDAIRDMASSSNKKLPQPSEGSMFS